MQISLDITEPAVNQGTTTHTSDPRFTMVRFTMIRFHNGPVLLPIDSVLRSKSTFTIFKLCTSLFSHRFV